MKKNMKSSSILLGGLFLLGAVCSCTQTAPDYASYRTSIRSLVREDMGIPIPER